MDLVHPDDGHSTEQKLKSIIEMSASVSCNVTHEFSNRMLNEQQEWRYFSHKLTPFRDENGRIHKWIGVSFDIHDQTVAKEEAEKMMNARSQMWSILSHEIRLPASCIIGNLELLLDLALTDKQRDLIMTSYRSAEGLLKLLNDILSFSKLDAGRVELEQIEFDPAQLMDGKEGRGGLCEEGECVSGVSQGSGVRWCTLTECPVPCTIPPSLWKTSWGCCIR